MTTLSITQPDVTLVMDIDGIIRNASFAATFAEGAVDDWVGRAWGDTVAGSGHDVVSRMIAEAQSSGVSAFNQIVQRLPSGRELAVEYTTLMLGGKAGFIAVGKSLQAVTDLQTKLVAVQQSMERDFWKLREVETRYRLLFEASNDPVLLVRDANLRISEANLAAVRALGLPATTPEGVVGMELLPALEPDSRKAIQALLARARDQGKSPAITIHLGKERRGWLVRSSLVMSEPGPVFLIQLSPSGKSRHASVEPDHGDATERLLERLPDGYVVVDGEGRITRCNMAFLDLVEISSAGAAVGEKLGRWLSRPGADWSVLFETLQRHRVVRLFATTILGELGTERRIEISAVGDTDSKPSSIALYLRDIERRLAPAEVAAPVSPAMRPIEERVGNQALKDIIDDAVSVLERQCIRAAMTKTSGNRRAASEMLGLSRQTLYTKISKYGLEAETANDLDGDE